MTGSVSNRWGRVTVSVSNRWGRLPAVVLVLVTGGADC